MRGVFIFSLLACTALVNTEKCSQDEHPGVTTQDNCYSIDIHNDQIAPDGIPRSAITIDGLMPGTLLTANRGEELYVQSNNRLMDDSMLLPTSVHWHGILQPKTAYDDGPAMVTQCPLIPGGNYTYKVETGQQTGTYWYHSHFSSQYVDGLRGPLVIYDRDEESFLFGYDDDEEADNESTIISITDWYHATSQEISHNPDKFPAPQFGDSSLFNGKGLYREPDNTDAKTTGERAVINVKQGKKYRLRLINMSARSSFTFGIERHALTVFEADGVLHQPIQVTSLQISAGQRYSVILHANQPANNYLIAYPTPDPNGVGAFAILPYQDALPPPIDGDGPDPGFEPDTSGILQEWDLIPFETLDFPNADEPLKLEFVFRVDQGDGKWYLRQRNQSDEFTYQAPDVPTLLEILTATGNQTAGFSKSVIAIPGNTTIEISLSGEAPFGGGHPFHLHGHTFEVVQSSGGVRNTHNPPIRDTVDTSVAAYGETPGPVTIRFPTNNAGPWFLHCHIDWHLEEGLAVVFSEDPEMQRKTLKPPMEWCQVCEDYDRFIGKADITARCISLHPQV